CSRPGCGRIEPNGGVHAMNAKSKTENGGAAREGRQARPKGVEPPGTSRDAGSTRQSGKAPAGGDEDGQQAASRPDPVPATITRAQALRELANRASQGSETALANLRTLLDRCPEVWQQMGDLARRAELAW